MDIQTSTASNSVIVKLDGRFDASVANDFKKTIGDLIDGGQVNFVIDLADVGYMDSTGLGSLVACLRRVGKEEGEIKLSSPTPKVRKVFELTRTHRIFDIYDDSSVAAQSFANPA